jgi:hypothetical protein
VGAYEHNAYFAVSVEPGDHHVCANLQSNHSAGVMALAHFSAEPGKVYYFRARVPVEGGIGAVPPYTYILIQSIVTRPNI